MKDILRSSINIPNIKPASDKPNPKLGIGSIQWSSDSKYLLTRNGNKIQLFLTSQITCQMLFGFGVQQKWNW